MNEELIARLEATTGPCRKLDAEIALAVGYTTYPDGYGEGDEWVDPQGNHLPRVVRMGAQPPKFSASIDAALTLLGEGWRPYTADFSVRGRTRWSLEGPKTQWATNEDGEKEPGDDWYAQGIGRTPALAICIAALRAGEAG